MVDDGPLGRMGDQVVLDRGHAEITGQLLPAAGCSGRKGQDLDNNDWVWDRKGLAGSGRSAIDQRVGLLITVAGLDGYTIAERLA